MAIETCCTTAAAPNCSFLQRSPAGVPAPCCPRLPPNLLPGPDRLPLGWPSRGSSMRGLMRCVRVRGPAVLCWPQMENRGREGPLGIYDLPSALDPQVEAQKGSAPRYTFSSEQRFRVGEDVAVGRCS